MHRMSSIIKVWDWNVIPISFISCSPYIYRCWESRRIKCQFRAWSGGFWNKSPIVESALQRFGTATWILGFGIWTGICRNVNECHNVSYKIKKYMEQILSWDHVKIILRTFALLKVLKINLLYSSKKQYTDSICQANVHFYPSNKQKTDGQAFRMQKWKILFDYFYMV